MKRENVSNELRMRISNYVQNMNKMEGLNQFEKEHEIINRLSLNL